MPAMLTHYCLAKRVLPHCPPHIDNEAFLLGAQGPDLLFFFRAYPWLPGKNGLPLGNALHESQPSRLFDTLRTLVSCAPQEYRHILDSYVCGFLCHYAADRTFHPFVCSRQNILAKQFPTFGRVSEPYHYRYESALDTWFAQNDLSSPVSRVSLLTVTPKRDISRDKALAWLYRRLLSRMLETDIAETKLKKLTADMRHSMRLMTDRFGIKRTAFRVLETVTRKGAWYSSLIRTDRIDDFDYLNTAHEPWEWERVVRCDDAAALRDETVDLAVTLIDRWQSGADGFALTQDMDFAGIRFTKEESADETHRQL